MPLTQDQLQLALHMVEELENPVRSLSRWELDFLCSVEDQLRRTSFLTERQLEKLTAVYKEKAE